MANEQVNVQLNLIANAEQAVKSIEAQLGQLKSKQLEIPVSFAASSTGTDKVKSNIESAFKASKAVELSYQDQEKLLSQQAKQLNSIISATKSVTGEGKGGARVLQDQLRKYDQARQQLEKVNTSLAAVRDKLNDAKARTDDWRRSLEKATNVVEKAPKSGGFFDSLLGKLTLGGIAVEAFKQALQGFGDFFNQGVAFEQLGLSLEAFAGGSEQAKDAYQSFKDTALKTPFSIEGVAQAGKTLLAFGLDLDTAKTSTKQLAIIAGATGSDLNNLARNLGQISAQGRAYTRDLNQFATAGIPIYQQLSVALGVSVQEVRNFVEEGRIGFADVQAALVSMTAAGTAFSELANRQLNTVAGQIGNVQTSVQELAGEFIKAFGPSIVEGLKGLKGALDFVKDNFDSISAAVIGLSTVAIAGKLIPALVVAFNWFKVISGITVFQNVINSVKLLTLAQAGLTGALGKTSLALAANQKALLAQQAAARAALIANLKFGAVLAGVAVAAILIQKSFSAYQPSEALKQDKDSADALSRSLDELNTKYQVAGVAADQVAPQFEAVAAALDKTYDRATNGILPFYDYALALRKAESDSIAFSEATQAQGAASLKLVQSNQSYLNSTTKSASATKEFLGVTRARIAAMKAENAGLEGTIELLKAKRPANEEEADLQRLYIQQAQTRINQNNNMTSSLERQLVELDKLLTRESLLQQFYSNPTVETRTAAWEATRSALDGVIKSTSALISAQKTLAEAPVNELKNKLALVSLEYDKQLGLLDQQKGRYQSLLTEIDALIARETQRTLGPAFGKESLGLQVRINQQLQEQSRNKLKTLKVGSLEYNQELNNLNTLYERGTALGIEYKYYDAQYAIKDKILDIDAAAADENARKLAATEDLERAIIVEQAAVDAVLISLSEQEAAIKNVEAAVIIAGSKIDENISGSINEGIAKARELQGVLSDIANRPLELTFSSTGQGAFDFSGAANKLFKQQASGGPVSGGSKYTVNELGKEAFLSASGRLSMIDAPAWGTWKAPSSGTVIPAHLTKQLKIPAGGINLNSPRTANISSSRLQRTGGNAAVSQAMHRISQAQQAQANELGRLSRAVDRMTDKNWNVDVNINGNNPLLNKLRRTR
jgi:tape measure domain-containing protein